MKDPMMVADKPSEEEKVTVTVTSKTSLKPKLQPITAPEAKEESSPSEAEVKPAEADEKPAIAAPEPAKEAPEAKTPAEPVEPKSETEPATLPSSDVREGDVIKDPAKEADEQERVETEKAMAIQKLVDSKEFFLPINSVEKRRTKRVVAAGVVLSIALALVWLNMSLDAGLLEIPGVQPVTHFF